MLWMTFVVRIVYKLISVPTGSPQESACRERKSTTR
ncbi:hypothetical protein ACVWXS_002435 [Lysinibacillus sp. TE18511]